MTVTAPAPAAAVEWLSPGLEYVPEHRRESFLTAIKEQKWKEPNGEHPFSPGMALQAVIREFGIRPVVSVSYNVPWYCPDGPETATYTVLGIKTRRQLLLFLDAGVSIAPVAFMPLDAAPQPDPAPEPAAAAPRDTVASEVATTIKRQITPGSLMAVGAHDFRNTRTNEGSPALIFKARILPMKADGTRASQPRIMHVLIALIADEYLVRVTYIKNGKLVTHFERDRVYADQLPYLILALDFDGDTVLNPRYA